MLIPQIGKCSRRCNPAMRISPRLLSLVPAMAAGGEGPYPWMSTDATYPYTLEIRPCEKPEGHFT